MRTAFATLILAAGLASTAQAQIPPAADPTVAAQPAPAQVPAAPAAPGVMPAAPAEPAPPPPVRPTTGDGAVILNVLETICVPAVRGQALDDIAKAKGGMKRNRRDGSWTMPLGGDKNYTVTVFAQGSNQDVCMAEVRYALGQEAAIVDALNVWSFLHDPQLILQANYVNVDPDGIKRVRKSWEHFTTNSSIGVNFSTMRKPDDSPLNNRYDTGMLFYQERKF